MGLGIGIQISRHGSAVVEEQDIAFAGQPPGNHVRAVYPGNRSQRGIRAHKGRSDLPHDISGLVIDDEQV